ncbi:MAG: hypothetical protein ACE5DN_02050, partial [Flavobacteriales bacterium]
MRFLVLSTAIAMTFADILVAQTNIHPLNPPLAVRGFTDQDIIQLHFDVQNTSGSNMNVMLRRDILYQVPGTRNSICWGIICYPDNVSETTSPSMIPPSGIDTTFLGDYRPQGREGITTVMYTFYDMANPSDSASVVVDFESLSTPGLFGSLTYCAGDSTALSTYAGYDSYLWSNGNSSQSVRVSAGTYWVDVALGSESRSSDTVAVSQSGSFLPQIAGLSAYCAGDSAWLATAAGFDHYLWTGGDTVNGMYVSAGTYTVTVTNNSGCSGISAPFPVNENAPPPIPLITWNDTLLSATQGDYYQWYKNGFVLYGENAQTLQPPGNGNYTVEVCDTQSWCCNYSDSIYITGMAEHPVPSFCAFPNPCDREIRFCHANGSAINIFDSTGRCIARLSDVDKGACLSLSTS